MTAARLAAFSLFAALSFVSARVGAVERLALGTPPPSWTTRADDDLARPSAAAGATSNGVRQRLWDRQVRVEGGRFESYWRRAIEVENESGLQEAAQIDVDFDPASESLALHSVVVHRGVETIDALDRDAVKVVEREPNLERQIFDGRKAAVLFVKDLRVHDVVEYDFTLRGADPTLGGRYEGAFFLGADGPIDHLRARLLTPRASPIAITLHGHGGEAANVERDADQGAFFERTWERRDVAGHPVEPDVPAWVEPYPWVQISQFASWEDVARWGVELFADPKANDAPIREWVARARREATEPGALALRALRFVQDEIRYVGVEVGMARRKPASPATVLARRYGDCKDKAALLVALLRAAGVESRPALVNVEYGESVARWGPSPAAFDHVIVRFVVDGAVHWADPTMNLEGGGIDRYVFSPYRAALVLDPSTVDLEAPLEDAGRTPAPDVHDHLRVAAPDAKVDALLDSERVYVGEVADRMRAVFRVQPLDVTSKQFLHLYEQDLPSIREVSPLERIDDRDANVLRVVAHYAIASPWTWQEKEGRHHLAVVARTLEAALPKPSITGRRLPLAVVYPFHERYRVDVDLPFDLPMTPETVSAKSAALGFTFRSSYSGRTLTYEYDVAAHARAVPVAKLSEHVDAIERARQTLFRSVARRAEGAAGTNGVAAAIVAALSALAALGAIAWARFEPVHLRRSPLPETYGRIGGWLVLLGLNVFVAPFVWLDGATKDAPAVLSRSFWALSTTPELPGYNPAGPLVAMSEIVVQAGFLGYSLGVAWLFATKRRGFRFHFVVYMVAAIAFHVVDLVVVHAVYPQHAMTPEKWGVLTRTFLLGAIWIAYVLGSARVRGTFTRPVAAARAPASPSSEPAIVGPVSE